MTSEHKKPEGNANAKPDDVEAPMSDERREALRKVLLSAACSVPVVTSLLAPRKTLAQPPLPLGRGRQSPWLRFFARQRRWT